MFKRFISDRSGNYAILTSVAALPLLLSVGFGVDYSRQVSARSHLQELADSAALAMVISGETDKEKLTAIAEEFIESNKHVKRLDTVTIASLEPTDTDVDIDLVTRIPTYFMGLVNVDTMEVNASALAKRAVTGSVEVALVLDNTESMNYDNKIGTLKTAATNLVTQLTSNKDADVRIGLVPYAEQINVGTSNRNASWISVPGDYSNSVTETTTTEGYWNQKTKKAVPNECETWKEAGSSTTMKDGVPVTTTWERSCSKWKMVNDGPPVWVPEKTTTKTTTTTYTWRGCVGMRVSGGKLVLNDGSPSVKYPGLMSKNNAFKCLTEIVPLTSNAATVKSAITGMITSRGGKDGYATYTPNTYIPGGMMWGINLLSSSEPFTEGLEYDPKNEKPRKVIVLMTDGLNTMRTLTSGNVNTDYLKSGSFIGDTASANATQQTQTNTDTTTLCTYAKAQKIEIFTVAFKVDDGAAKTMLQDCATDKSHYYDASDESKLLAAFSGIAQSLTQVRLAR
ncbi:MAG: TadE/TadG family type IV pilus assembly protein [Rhizobiaceae bacterium]